ncbi:hypothetical protein U9M48_011879 [Paspalum notatum var. saurae]|uniref:Leucine-rich repeat-containing N-terminal plant-type domain-containing protein n=1 Tax=Paspalum notatum var. saurae TaxID=547442 RepID=A0AAQ3SYN4_PASNO
MNCSSAAKLLLLITTTTCSLLVITPAALQLQPANHNTVSATTTCIPRERDALLAFKRSITSDPSGFLDSWQRDDGLQEQDCCRWRGVGCSNSTGHVLQLRLGNENPPYYYYNDNKTTAMVGKISPSLLALENLEYLDLSNNNLVGSSQRIPEFLGALKNLKYLNLSGIQFVGEVPPQLGNLSELQYLDLSYMSSAKSTDISWLTRLPSLHYLNLANVYLDAVLDWPHIMNMIPSLRVLDLSTCSLTSANQSLLRLNLTDLEELDLSGNDFYHPVASCWFWNITRLKYLNLASTGLDGTAPVSKQYNRDSAQLVEREIN